MAKHEALRTTRQPSQLHPGVERPCCWLVEGLPVAHALSNGMDANG